MRTRQSNLELLRIIGILMIVMMHFTSQAGIPTSGNIFAARSVFAVYVIHQIPAFMHYEWHTIFHADWLIRQSVVMQSVGIPAVAVLVFAGASLIDALRIWLEPNYLALRPVQWLVNWFSKLYPESECS